MNPQIEEWTRMRNAKTTVHMKMGGKKAMGFRLGKKEEALGNSDL